VRHLRHAHVPALLQRRKVEELTGADKGKLEALAKTADDL
jgi:hypothetical protein